MTSLHINNHHSEVVTTLPTIIIIHYIFPFINDRKTWNNLSITNKEIYNFVMNNNQECYNESTLSNNNNDNIRMSCPWPTDTIIHVMGNDDDDDDDDDDGSLHTDFNAACVLFACNDTILLYGGNIGVYKINVRNGQKCINKNNKKERMRLIQDPISTMCTVDDNQVAAAIVFDYTIEIWSILSGCKLKVLMGHDGIINCLSFSSSLGNKMLLSSSTWDATMRIWDLQTNHHDDDEDDTNQHSTTFQILESVAMLRAHQFSRYSMDCVTFSNNNINNNNNNGGVGGLASSCARTCLYAMSCEAGPIRLLNIYDSSKTMKLLGHSTKVTQLSFSPDNSFLVSASLGTIQIWNVQRILQESNVNNNNMMQKNTSTITTTHYCQQSVEFIECKDNNDNDMNLITAFSFYVHIKNK